MGRFCFTSTSSMCLPFYATAGANACAPRGGRCEDRVRGIGGPAAPRSDSPPPVTRIRCWIQGHEAYFALGLVVQHLLELCDQRRYRGGWEPHSGVYIGAQLKNAQTVNRKKRPIVGHKRRRRTGDRSGQLEHRREHFADLLWADLPSAAGRQAVRQAMWEIKRRTQTEVFERPSPDAVTLAVPIAFDRDEFLCRIRARGPELGRRSVPR